MDLPIDVAFAGLIGVPAIIALASGGKDPTTRGIVGALALIAIAVIVGGYVGDLRELLGRLHLPLILALGAAALAIAATVRLQNRVIGALLLVGAFGLAGLALGVLGGARVV